MTPLRIERHHALGAGEQIVEGAQRPRARDRPPPQRRRATAPIARAASSASSKPETWASIHAAIERASVGEMGKQAVEQQYVRAGRERQMQIGGFGGDGAARVDVDDLRSALLARRHQALIEHRMAPGHVAADLNDEIGFFQILVAARHDILAEGAHMAGDRGRHAEPRIGVDIARADEALHQLVGDVIVFGQELAGDIEGDRIRPMRIADARELRRDEIRAPDPNQPAGRSSSAWSGGPAEQAWPRAPRLWNRADRN